MVVRPHDFVGYGFASRVFRSGRIGGGVTIPQLIPKKHCNASALRNNYGQYEKKTSLKYF